MHPSACTIQRTEATSSTVCHVDAWSGNSQSVVQAQAEGLEHPCAGRRLGDLSTSRELVFRNESGVRSCGREICFQCGSVSSCCYFLLLLRPVALGASAFTFFFLFQFSFFSIFHVFHVFSSIFQFVHSYTFPVPSPFSPFLIVFQSSPWQLSHSNNRQSTELGTRLAQSSELGRGEWGERQRNDQVLEREKIKWK